MNGREVFERSLVAALGRPYRPRPSAEQARAERLLAWVPDPIVGELHLRDPEPLAYGEQGGPGVRVTVGPGGRDPLQATVTETPKGLDLRVARASGRGPVAERDRLHPRGLGPALRSAYQDMISESTGEPENLDGSPG